MRSLHALRLVEMTKEGGRDDKGRREVEMTRKEGGRDDKRLSFRA